MICQSCGVRLPEDALFCTSCGVSTSVKAAAPPWDAGVRPPAMPDNLFRDAPSSESADSEDTKVRPPWAADPAATPQSWQPLAAGTPEADLLPSERPPAPTEFLPLPPTQKRGNGFLILAALLTLVLVGGVIGVIVIVANSQPPRPAPSTPPPQPSASVFSSSAPPRPSSVTASASPSVSTSESASASPSSSASDAFPPAGATMCSGSDTIAVGANTSCEFAANVAAAIPEGSSGSFQVNAKSPVTGKDYTMSCTKTIHTVCTGGNNATVYVK